MKTRLGVVCLLAAAATGIAACGSSSSSSSTTSSGTGGANTIDVYSSLPLQGASSAQTMPMVNGIKLALSEAAGKAGTFTVNYTSLDDSTAQAGAWDPRGDERERAQGGAGQQDRLLHRRVQLGREQAGDPDPQPGGHRRGQPGQHLRRPDHQRAGRSAPGEPLKYYPTGKRNYLRIVPRDTIQAAALLKTMKSDGCTNAAVANDKDTYGAGPGRPARAREEPRTGSRSRATRASTRRRRTSVPTRRRSSRQGADCFVFSGIVANGGVQITKDVAAALPNAKLYGPDGMCSNAWTNPAKGGVPLSIDKNIQCTVATLDLKAYPGGKTFLAAYKAKYGVANPDPYAIYGYEAMKLGLDTIAGLGAQGQRQGRGPGRAVRHQEPGVGARHLRVRRERRHDAEDLRPLQGRPGREPAVREDGHVTVRQ